MANITEAQVKVLEKVLSDADFRTSFFKNPPAAVAKAGIAISEEEMAAIKSIDIARMKSALADIDERISKSTFGAADVGSAIEEMFTSFFVV